MVRGNCCQNLNSDSSLIHLDVFTIYWNLPESYLLEWLTDDNKAYCLFFWRLSEGRQQPTTVYYWRRNVTRNGSWSDPLFRSWNSSCLDAHGWVAVHGMLADVCVMMGTPDLAASGRFGCFLLLSIQSARKHACLRVFQRRKWDKYVNALSFDSMQVLGRYHYIFTNPPAVLFFLLHIIFFCFIALRYSCLERLIFFFFFKESKLRLSTLHSRSHLLSWHLFHSLNHVLGLLWFFLGLWLFLLCEHGKCFQMCYFFFKTEVHSLLHSFIFFSRVRWAYHF